ncbi:tyrosine-type recombinase/integrase [Dactylosporangium sp. NPDC048998]|uniref:tyrosine-type recombinase/integrase n=1 Tax=Dactylosporangium sp. NPDC048998 TaxID=3363976 RepID=UPI00371E5C40
MREFPPVPVQLVDIISGEPVPRTVPLLFTTGRGNRITDKIWSREWGKWRAVAGWPNTEHRTPNTEHAGFHALRHFFATVQIANHVEPQEVQRALRHKTLTITLETYVHWWPKRTRQRGLIGAALRRAAGRK